VRKRGYLVVSLLLLAVMLVVSLGMLLRQPLSYHRAGRRVESLQARALAEAGLEHLRVQLMNDWRTWRQLDPEPMSLTELVHDPVTREVVGAYRVTLDRRWEKEIYKLVRVESEGFSGSLSQPRARFVLQAVLDLSETDRAGGTAQNPDYFRFIERSERVP
jgi:hypothetical protein